MDLVRVIKDNKVIDFIGRKPDGLALWINADISIIIQYYFRDMIC
jgi:hypothetical protein